MSKRADSKAAGNKAAEKKRGLAAWLGGVSMVVLGASGAAQAQAPVADSDEEIVITAERRVQSLQEVPIAATVLNSEMLADRGVDNMNEIQQVAPSIAINTYNRSTFINIRGVGIAQSAPTSNPGVATYIDGMLIAHEQHIGGSFYDIASVEVLRGPQGTFTGQNSTGGAIYIRTPEPRLGDLFGFVDQTVSEYNGHRTVAAVNIPVGPYAAARIAGVYDQRDSFTENLGTGALAQPGNVDYLGYRIAFRVDPSEAMKINLRYEHHLNDTYHSAVKARPALDPNPNPFQIDENGQSDFYQNGHRASAEVTYDFSGVRARWISSTLSSFTQDITDGDRTDAGVNRLSYARTDFDTTTHEFNLISNDEGNFDWLFGAFVLEERIPVSLLRWNNLVSLPTGLAPSSSIITEAVNESQSMFGQVSWRFAPAWELQVGARYSEDKQTYTRSALPGPMPPLGTTSAESEQPTGKIALNWKPSDNAMYYLSVARGYKAGGVNLQLADGNFGPEENTVYELGMKRRFWDDQVTVNGALFFSDYQGAQLSSLVGGLPVTQNAAATEAYGAEVEVLGRFGNFALNAGVGYLDNKFNGASCIQDTNAPTPGYVACASGFTVPDGQVFPFSPEWTINAGVEYDFNFGDQTVTPRLQAAHLSEQYATPFIGQATTVPDRTILDASLVWKPTDVIRLEGFVTNLTDETYVASQIQNTTSAQGGTIYGAPRQIGARLTYKFN